MPAVAKVNFAIISTISTLGDDAQTAKKTKTSAEDRPCTHGRNRLFQKLKKFHYNTLNKVRRANFINNIVQRIVQANAPGKVQELTSRLSWNIAGINKKSPGTI